MKLATLNDGSRDGQLAVVSRDLASAHFATGIATTLQQVLDDWNFIAPQLEDLAATLNDGKARHAFAFDTRLCMAPLPRAYQWVQAQPQPAGSDDAGPQLVRHASDDFLGPHDDVPPAPAAGAIGFGAALAVVTGDVAFGADADVALDGVRLLMLASACGQATTFAPVAVTPDEAAAAWRGGRLHLALEGRCNGRRVGLVDAAAGMPSHFGVLIAQAAATRRLRAGSIVGSAPIVSADGVVQAGDELRAEVLDGAGASVFGAIEHKVAAAAG